MVYCNKCSSLLEENEDVCPHCGQFLDPTQYANEIQSERITENSQTGGSHLGYPRSGVSRPDDTLRYLNDRIEQNKRRQASTVGPSVTLLKEDRLSQIIQEFELKSDVIYKQSQSAHIYPARTSEHFGSHSSSYTRLSSEFKALMIVLSVLITIPALITSIIFINHHESAYKKLGFIMLWVSIGSTLLWLILSSLVFFNIAVNYI